MNELEGQVIKAIGASVKELFETMISLPVTVGDVTEDKSCIQKDITGMIGLAGEYQGIITVYFPEEIALRIVSGMIGMEINEINADVQDAIGEVANIIVGGAKNELYLEGIHFDISTPTVVVGNDYMVYSSKSQVQQISIFKIDAAHFYISSYVKKAD